MGVSLYSPVRLKLPSLTVGVGAYRIQPCPIKIWRADRGVGAHGMRPRAVAHTPSVVAPAVPRTRWWPPPSLVRGGGGRWAHAMRPYAAVTARPTLAPQFLSDRTLSHTPGGCHEPHVHDRRAYAIRPRPTIVTTVFATASAHGRRPAGWTVSGLTLALSADTTKWCAPLRGLIRVMDDSHGYL